MNKIKKLLLIISILLGLVKNSNSLEVYPMFGAWDYAHHTDAYAINLKFVDNENPVKTKFLGELQRTYDASFFIDINDGFKNLEHSNNDWRSELSIYAATGLAKPLPITSNKKLNFIPSFSLGFYQEFEEGKDMGFPIEFKTEFGLNYSLFKNSTIGVSWNHISNADIGSKNPGSDNILFLFRVKEKF